MSAVVRAPNEVRFAVLPPLALYAHLPWCVRKCPYCDFNSHEKKDALPEREYVEALVADLEGLLPSVWGRRVTSVFIGGGTPSLFSPESIDALLAAIRARVTLEPGAEVTLETSPKLQALLARSLPTVRVVPAPFVAAETGAERFDVMMPVGSLGRHLRATADRFPREGALLAAEYQRQAGEGRLKDE